MSYIPSQRIRRIEAAVHKRFHDAPQGIADANKIRAFFELFADLELPERQACTYAYALVNEPVFISPDECIHGIFYRKSGDPFCGYGPTPAWDGYNAQHTARKRIESELPELLDYFASSADGSPPRTFIVNEEATPGHIAWRWDWVLRDGLDAIITRHQTAAETAADETARAYYRGVVICLEAILEWNRQHVRAIEALQESGQCTPEQRQRLAECAQVMRRVPAQPARTFHEALQAYHFMWLSAFYDGPYGGNSPGRFDFLLWPFLREEYESGRLSYEEATELVAETFLKCDEAVHPDDGSVLTIVTGGLDREFNDAVSPLSFMVLDAIEALDVTHPAVYNRISIKNPVAYRQRCYQYMLRGNNRGQFLNEEAILHAMTRDGYMSKADAAMYICGGCMELNPQGLMSDLFWSFRINICKILELCLTGGHDLVTGTQRLAMPKSLGDCPDFESFYAYFEAEVEKLIHLKCLALDIAAEEIGRLRPQFVISSMIDDCFARGRNHMQGGSRHSDYGGAIIGLPNIANCLMAVKTAVYGEGFCTPEELLDALKANFQGHENLRLRLRHLPKYGEQNSEADGIMNRLMRSVDRILNARTTLNGGKCKQVLLTFRFAPSFGAALGATAEGNLAGTPVAHGLTPVNNKQGLSTAMQSYLSLDNCLVSGGASTMWDMDSEWINEALLGSVYAVFEDGGGQIFQGNMSAVKELEAVLENPETRPDLIVRVGGFSARFMNLSREERQEIVQRRRWK
jgi:formate C-acetyltransferase